ncbi:unnamed protein product, partial [Cyprideis torosa]
MFDMVMCRCRKSISVIGFKNRSAKLLYILSFISITAWIVRHPFPEVPSQGNFLEDLSDGQPGTHFVPLDQARDITTELLKVYDNDPGHSEIRRLITRLPPARPMLSTLRRHETHPIFLVETRGRESLTTRIACAVESAAKYHPNSKIFLLMTSEFLVLDPSSLSVLQIKNVNVAYLNLKDFFEGTALDSWFHSKERRSSPHVVSHTSDAIRFALLYEFGGTFLDTDVIVLKPFSQLRSTLGLQGKKVDPLANGAVLINFDLSPDGEPHPLISTLVQELPKNYKPKVWGCIGPNLITRVLKSEEWCNATVLSKPRQQVSYYPDDCPFPRFTVRRTCCVSFCLSLAEKYVEMLPRVGGAISNQVEIGDVALMSDDSLKRYAVVADNRGIDDVDDAPVWSMNFDVDISKLTLTRFMATARSEGKAEVVFEKRIFDMPTMLDLSVLYVSGNRKQLELMWQSLLKHQPKFIDSLKKGLSFVPTVLDSLGPAAASSSADVCTLVSDSCLSIRAFLETCPEAVPLAWSAEVHHSFSGFYERVLNASTLGSSVQGKPCVRAKKAILSLYRHLVLENCIQPSLRGENPSQNILDLIDAFQLSLDNEPTFMHDYLLNFPLAVDWLPMSERLQKSHDAANRDFLSQKMQPSLSLAQQIPVKKTESPAPSPATSSSKKGGARPKVPLPAVPQEQPLSEVGTSGQVHTIPSSTTPAVPSNGPPSREENRACLAHYDMDPEAVIDALLTENLPDHLSRMDRAAPDASPTSSSEGASKKTSKLGAKPKQPSPPSTVKAVPEGAKIYKKDRRNLQSDLKAEYVDKSHLVGSVRDAILHTQFEAEVAEDLDPMLQKDMEPLNIAFEY